MLISKGDGGAVDDDVHSVLEGLFPVNAAAALFSGSAAVGLPRWQSWLAGTFTALTPRYRRLVSGQLDSLEAIDQLGVRLSPGRGSPMPFSPF